MSKDAGVASPGPTANTVASRSTPWYQQWYPQNARELVRITGGSSWKRSNAVHFITPANPRGEPEFPPFSPVGRAALTEPPIQAQGSAPVTRKIYRDLDLLTNELATEPSSIRRGLPPPVRRGPPSSSNPSTPILGPAEQSVSQATATTTAKGDSDSPKVSQSSSSSGNSAPHGRGFIERLGDWSTFGRRRAPPPSLNEFGATQISPRRPRGAPGAPTRDCRRALPPTGRRRARTPRRTRTITRKTRHVPVTSPRRTAARTNAFDIRRTRARA
ncbi:hypothetical protein BJY52DRAFT_1191571 [Lactarius psammicola]|nr:hypothetical protein BJY52DRAFT_1191571 [Lactarius psammicola]